MSCYQQLWFDARVLTVVDQPESSELFPFVSGKAKAIVLIASAMLAIPCVHRSRFAFLQRGLFGGIAFL